MSKLTRVRNTPLKYEEYDTTTVRRYNKGGKAVKNLNTVFHSLTEKSSTNVTPAKSSEKTSLSPVSKERLSVEYTTSKSSPANLGKRRPSTLGYRVGKGKRSPVIARAIGMSDRVAEDDSRKTSLIIVTPVKQRSIPELMRFKERFDRTTESPAKFTNNCSPDEVMTYLRWFRKTKALPPTREESEDEFHGQTDGRRQLLIQDMVDDSGTDEDSDNAVMLPVQGKKESMYRKWKKEKELFFIHNSQIAGPSKQAKTPLALTSQGHNESGKNHNEERQSTGKEAEKYSEEILETVKIRNIKASVRRARLEGISPYTVNLPVEDLVRTAMVEIELSGILDKYIDDVLHRKQNAMCSSQSNEDTENDWIFVKDYGDSSEQLVTNNCTSCRTRILYKNHGRIVNSYLEEYVKEIHGMDERSAELSWKEFGRLRLLFLNSLADVIPKDMIVFDLTTDKIHNVRSKHSAGEWNDDENLAWLKVHEEETQAHKISRTRWVKFSMKLSEYGVHRSNDQCRTQEKAMNTRYIRLSKKPSGSSGDMNHVDRRILQVMSMNKHVKPDCLGSSRKGMERSISKKRKNENDTPQSDSDDDTNSAQKDIGKKPAVPKRGKKAQYTSFQELMLKKFEEIEQKQEERTDKLIEVLKGFQNCLMNRNNNNGN